MLDAAASIPGGATRLQMSVFSALSMTSSSFIKALAGGTAKDGKRPSLVQAGLLSAEGEKFIPTEAGMSMAKPARPKTLHDWLKKFSPSESKILECLAHAYPERLTREQVAERTGLSATSSSLLKAFPKLRGMGLIEGKSDYAAMIEIAASAHTHQPRSHHGEDAN